MEAPTWPESLPSSRIKAIQELTKGQILTNKLRDMIVQPEKNERDLKSMKGVVAQVVEMFDNTLSILSFTNLNGILCIPTNDVGSPSNSEDSGKSIKKTMAPLKTKRGCYKRRKNVSTITKVTSNLIDDGYAWRKYGQKAILNLKHQRNYYRCTHKFEQGCQATKQVQKTDDKPSKYKITYHGLHTCNNSQRTPQIIMEAQDPRDNSTLISFERNTLMGRNKVGTCFPLMKHTPKEGFPYLGSLKQEQVSSLDHHTSWDQNMGLSQVPSEPMSMMSCVLDCENTSGVFSSTCSSHGYEIEDVTDSHDYDFLFELY